MTQIALYFFTSPEHHPGYKHGSCLVVNLLRLEILLYNGRNERFSIRQAPPSASIAFGQPGSSVLSASPSSEHPGAGQKVREKEEKKWLQYLLVRKNE